jgi:hypothetical protein
MSDNFLALAALRQGEHAQGERLYRKQLSRSKAGDAWVGPVFAALRDPALRPKAIASIAAENDDSRDLMDEFAFVYALIGADAEALAALETLARGPVLLWASNVWLPEMAAVRRQPAFSQYLHAMKLPALWDARGAPDLCEKQAGGEWRCR